MAVHVTMEQREGTPVLVRMNLRENIVRSPEDVSIGFGRKLKRTL